MNTGKNRNFVEHLTWDRIEQRIAGGAAAILPIGAGAKQHGFHLREYRPPAGGMARRATRAAATREKGEILLTAMVDDIREQAASFLSSIASAPRNAAQSVSR